MNLIGIDPGIVHTGVTAFSTSKKRADTKRAIAAAHRAVNGMRPPDVLHAVTDCLQHCAFYAPDNVHVFIEAYRPRVGFGTDAQMVAGVADLFREIKIRYPQTKLVNNTGVLKIVKKPVMRTLGLWDYPNTHHKDLESAARIMLYGAYKDNDLNTELAQTYSERRAVGEPLGPPSFGV